MSFSADAIAGAVGVVIGSVTTGGFQLWLARRSERREGRAARRVVYSELHAMHALVRQGAERGDSYWPYVTADLERTKGWDRYADGLARDRDFEYKKVHGAYMAIEQVGRLAKTYGSVPTDVCELALDSTSAAVAYLRTQAR